MSVEFFREETVGYAYIVPLYKRSFLQKVFVTIVCLIAEEVNKKRRKDQQLLVFIIGSNHFHLT